MPVFSGSFVLAAIVGVVAFAITNDDNLSFGIGFWTFVGLIAVAFALFFIWKIADYRWQVACAKQEDAAIQAPIQ